MTLVLMFVSLAIAGTMGFLLMRLGLPGLPRGRPGLVLTISGGAGLGVGIASLGYFLALLAGDGRLCLGIDLLGLLLAVLIFRQAHHRKKPGPIRPEERPQPAGVPVWLPRLTALVFAGGAALSLVSFVLKTLGEPQGRWDAWLIWNMHARFLYRGADAWREAFASGLDWSHWDYPLLLPLSIARGWTYMGAEETLLPALMALLFSILVIGLVVGAVGLHKGLVPGCLAGLVLLGTPFFIAMGASQFADIPLAFFLLLTMVLLVLGAREAASGRGALVLAGVAAGLAAWTKNEGLLFVGLVTLVLLAAAAVSPERRAALARPAWFFCGALPVLLVVAVFKTLLAPTNDLVAGVGLSALTDKLFDPSRYAEIARAYALTAVSFTQGIVDIRKGMRPNLGAVSLLLPVIYLGIAGIRPDRREARALRLVALILTLMLIGYFFVYVLTPLDLNYHLVTSLNRLFLQLWPGFVFAIFMAAASPWEAPAEDGPPAGTASGRGQDRRGKENGSRRK